jgi:hypothetical protein
MCYDTTHDETPAIDCVELSPELQKFASLYPSQGGLALSSALKAPFDAGKAYPNAPRTYASGKHMIIVKSGKALRPPAPYGDDDYTEVYQTPVDRYSHVWGLLPPPPPPSAPDILPPVSPPPSAPPQVPVGRPNLPPSPSPPPFACFLDSVRVIERFRTESVDYGLFTAKFEYGSDGNLVQEFVAMETIMHTQYTASLSTESATGTHQAYVCAVKTVTGLECLDIAAASTGKGQLGIDTEYKLYTGSLRGNVFAHTDAMYTFDSAGVYNLSTTQLFGQAADCWWGENGGDGAITALDIWVLMAAQFKIGVYQQLGSSFANVSTTSVRPDTADRCVDPGAAPPPSRLQWNTKIIDDPCYYNTTNTLTVESSVADSVERDVEPPQLATLPGAVTLNAFGLGLDDFQSVGGGEQGRRLSSTGERPNDMKVTVIEVVSVQDGAWYWINIPSVHLALDLTLLGVDNESPLPLSNEAIPQSLSVAAPADPSSYEMRYIRHREFYNFPTDDCAPLQAARGVSAAMERGVVSISQMPTGNTKACGVDLAVWKPAGTLPHASGCAIAVSFGSTGMDGGYGSVQRSTACSISLASSINTSEPVPPDDTNTTLYDLELFVTLNDGGAFHNNQTAKSILKNAVAVKFDVKGDNVVVGTQELTTTADAGRRLQTSFVVTEVTITIKDVARDVAEDVRRYVNENRDQEDGASVSVKDYFNLPFEFPATKVRLVSIDLPPSESDDGVLVVVIISGFIGVFACVALVFVVVWCIRTDDPRGGVKDNDKAMKYAALPGVYGSGLPTPSVRPGLPTLRVRL